MDPLLVSGGGDSSSTDDEEVVERNEDPQHKHKLLDDNTNTTKSSSSGLLEPLNNLISPTSSEHFGYDDEDFAAVLLSLGGGVENNHNDGVFDNNNDDNNTDGQQHFDLPDIDIDFGNGDGDHDDNDFFLDSDQLANIFDVVNDEEQQTIDKIEEGQHPRRSSINERQEQNLQTRKNDNNIDSDTAELYSELANLKIGSDDDNDNNNNNNNQEITNSSLPDDNYTIPSSSTDGLPSYLYCHPCSDDKEEEDPFLPLQQFFPSISEDTHLPEEDLTNIVDDIIGAESFIHQREHTEEDEILRLSSLTLNDNDDDDHHHHHHGNNNDDLIAKMDVKYNEKMTMNEATPFLKSFGVMEQSTKSNKQRSCFGHKETIYGVTFSPCGKYCATASQDSTINVWDVEKNAVISTLNGHSKDFECLRVAWASSSWSEESLDRSSDDDLGHLLATSGADGTVKLWSCSNPRNGWTCRSTIDHAELLGKKDATKSSSDNDTSGEPEEQPDVPQIYALQFIDHWRAFTVETEQQTKNSFLMTSSDDYVHLWEATIHPSSQKIQLIEDDEETKIAPETITLAEVMSIHFGELSQSGFGETTCNLTASRQQVAKSPDDDAQQPLGKKRKGFGGDRNPNNLIFVFDASYCGANGLLGAALSDGSLRLVNGRGICISILNLPGCQSHLTSFCWDSTGSRLATTVATGHLITWNLDIDGDLQGRGNTVATCTGIMEGGHQVGRPLFGARYCGLTEKCLVSWGVDGSLCLWDSYSQGNIDAPMAVLKHDPEYPIYAVEVSKTCIAVGGGSDGGFMGVPLFLYSYSYDNPEKTKLSDDITMVVKNVDASSNKEQLDGNILPSPNEQSKEVMN